MILITLRESPVGCWLTRLVILIALVAAFSAGGTIAFAYEPILVNLFRGPIPPEAGKPITIAAEPSGVLHLLREVSDPDQAFRFNVNGLQIGSPATFGENDFSSLAIDSAGNRYIGAFGRLIAPISTIVTPTHDVDVDGAGNVYALQATPIEGSVLRKYSPQLQFISEHRFDERVVNGTTVNVTNVAVDPAGNIYANYNNRLVVKVAPDGQGGPEFELGFFAIAYDPTADAFVGVDGERIRRFDTNGQLLNEIPLPEGADAINVSVDVYGSIYATDPDKRTVFGFDQAIATSALVAAARQFALAGVPLNGSPEGEYFKGLARRAGRTSDNLRALAEARQQLSQLRSLARGTDVDGAGPTAADRISRATERANGLIKSVWADSPLIAGEHFAGLNVPAPEPTNPFTAFIQGIFAEDPFYGRYHASQPIASPPPAHLELALDAATATTSFIRPQIWGGSDVVEPQVISSRVVLDFNSLVPTVSDFTMVLGSIDINGMPSGINRGRLSPSGQLHSQLGRQGRDFTANVEGWITNDLYTDSRPIFSFLDLEGYVARGTEVGVYGTNEPLIVPGLPGEAPTDLAGVGFAATRAEFNQATASVVFHENTDPSKTPDLSVILTPEGVFAHGVGSGEPAVGAGISITPLVFTGLDAMSGRYEFADAVLTFISDSGPFGSALLTDIGIDPETLIFTGELDFNVPLLRSDSPFINTMHAGPVDILLLTPSGTLELLTRTANFTRSGMTQTDFIVLGVVPEPNALALCAAALSVLLVFPRRQIARPSVAG